MNAPLLAMAAQKEEETRRPRRQDRIPVDVVSEDHNALHALLCRWGRWQGERSYRGSTLASVESLYEKVSTPPSTAPMAADPMLMAVERAVIGMPKAHRETIRDLYVYRWTPYTICSAIRPRLRYEAWPAWIRICRCMVANRMRMLGVAPPE